MCRHVLCAIGAFAALLSFQLIPVQGQLADPIPPKIPLGPVTIKLQTVASALVSPDLLVQPNDGTGRKFIVDQSGKILILKEGAVQATPFMDVTSRIVVLSGSYDERGLLGFAFDPGFTDPASPGFRRVFTYTSEPNSGVGDYPQSAGTANHQSVIASWRVNPASLDQIDPTTRQELLRFDEPQSNHNGGHIRFGQDGMLYIAAGDGGNQNDTGTGHNATIGNGQDINTPLGKILRIDVNGTNSTNGKYGIPAGNPFSSGAGGLKEIYAYGFRNPYRFSFDGARLLVADVGQNKIEELDDVVAGGDYGWRYKEGTFRFDPATGGVFSDLTGVPAGLTDPILQYDHDEGISIIGGFVYHGTYMPELSGKYVFGDFSTSFAAPAGRLFYADLSVPGDIHELLLTTGPLGRFIKGIGQDAAGELYVMATTNLGPSGTTGTVFLMVPEPASLALLMAGIGLPLMRRRRAQIQ